MDVFPIDDLDVATAILTHPSIWPSLVNDDAPPLDEFQAPDIFTYFLAAQDGEPAGLFGLRALGGDVLMHAAMLPEHRGTGTLRAVAGVLGWVWANTPAPKVRVRFEAWNHKARAASVRAGFKECGRIPGAVRRDGQRVDLIEMEVCRGLSG